MTDVAEPGGEMPAAEPSPEPRPPVYCCYGCRLASDITKTKGAAGVSTLMLTRLGVAVFLSMNVMMFAMALYANDIYASAPEAATPSARGLTSVLRYLSLLMATPVLVLLGWPMWQSAVARAREGAASLDALIVLGVGASFAYSYWSTFTDRGPIYFETGCAVLAFVTLGRWFEAHAKLKAADEMRAIERLLPERVTVERAAGPIEVAPSALLVDDRLVVAAGQRCAADGVVETGCAHVDEQILTGESTPVERAVGSTVRAGTMVLDGTLVVRVTAVGAEDAIGRLVARLDEARRAKGRYERLAERVARHFVPATVVLAAVGAIRGLERGGIEDAMLTGLAVTLIACPCTLGIATPLAMWVGLGRAAREGVLFRSGEALEALAHVEAVCFDKTGTLTTGAPRISAIVAQQEGEGAMGAVLAAGAGLVRGVTHPFSRGVADFAARRDIPAVAFDRVTTVPGRGLEGSVEGRTVALGSTTFMAERGLHMDETLRAALADAESTHAPVVCVGWDGAVRGLFVFAELMRDSAPAAIARVEALGCGVAMLTGDRAARADEVAATLGVQSAAELSPDDKWRTLDVLRAEHGAVAMVGDGLNDAPALARADVGIALGCGVDVARDAADVCLTGNDLTRVPWAMALARRTVRTMKQNLFWAAAYNAVGVPLAMSGGLSPAWAALAMVVSSVFVVSNSLALARLELEVSR